MFGCGESLEHCIRFCVVRGASRSRPVPPPPYPDRVTLPSIAVRVRDDAHARIAWAVASHPEAGRVVMVGRKPPPSWGDLVEHAKSSAGVEVVVDPNPDDPGLVVTAGPSQRSGITHASPEGLARSLLVRLGEPGAEPAWTVVGRPLRSGRSWSFPPPLGVVLADDGRAPVEGDLAGAGAFGQSILAVVDDRRFFEAICIAAGAAVADPGLDRPTPVWERAEDYLAACETLGLVIAGA
jgi:hypothetical protein